MRVSREWKVESRPACPAYRQAGGRQAAGETLWLLRKSSLGGMVAFSTFYSLLSPALGVRIFPPESILTPVHSANDNILDIHPVGCIIGVAGEVRREAGGFSKAR